MTKPSWQDFGTHDESAVPELWNGVVGAWAPCLGPTGSRLHDHSQSVRWGTITDLDVVADWSLSDGQYSLNFDTLAKIADLNTQLSVLHGQPAMTMSVWFRRTAANGIVSCGPVVGGSYNNIVAFSDGNVYFQMVPNFVGFADNTLVWNHYVMVFRSGSIVGYKNGAQVASTTGPASVPAVAANYTLGRYQPQTTAANGRIDDHAVWGRALSPNEVRQLYQLGRGGMYQRRRRRAIYLPQAGFQAAWALRRSQIIGGGLR